jgi:Tol biopolymer transport system component/DNA-binding winged helix-turn-helix (wHTH) protein
VEPTLDPKLALRFGLYEVDLVQGTLTRQGVRLKLQEQPFRILALLLQKPGEIVTREELRQALWPEGTHVNFDGSLNAALKKLRASIQDDAENPRFIETIPRQGYRFLAPVHTIHGAVTVLSPPPDSPQTGEESFEVRLRLQPELSPERAAELSRERHKAERATRWFDLTLQTCAILFGSWLLFFIVYPVPRPSVQRMTRITNASGIDEWGGIVSDGTRIFFLEQNSGRWNLMQTSVEGGNAEMMAAPFENTRLFAISPDHSQFIIGQFSRRDDEMPLWLWPVQGGAPRRMGEAVGHDPAWSPDGSQIVFVRGRSLFMLHSDGTQLREITHMNGPPHSPAWSPDGENIRFSVDQRQDGKQAIWEMNADGTSLHTILPNTSHPSAQSAGQWTADGKYFLFSGCESFDCNLWAIRDAWNWLRRSHHDPVQMTHGPDSLHVSIPSQAGSRVFAFSFRAQRELQRIDPRTKHSESLILNSHAEEAMVSPDGQLAVYVDRPDGSLWRSRTDGTQGLRLTKTPLVASSPRWSQDGKQILFTGVRLGQWKQIYLQSVDGGALRAVLPEGREASGADWSPDASQIVVSMRDQKTQPKYGIYLFKPTTGEWTVLPESRGLGEPRWSPDGRYIAALDETKHRLLVYDFLTEKWSTLAEGGLLGVPYWSRDAAAIYFQDQLDEKQPVFRIRIANRKSERVFDFGEILRGSPTHCLFSGIDQQGSLYVMIERGLTDIYALDLDLP